MDYTPGLEDLEPRSLRLPKDAWKEIERRAREEQRKPLDWLRSQIYQRVLNGGSRRRAAA